MFYIKSVGGMDYLCSTQEPRFCGSKGGVPPPGFDGKVLEFGTKEFAKTAMDDFITKFGNVWKLEVVEE
jgi:hypothetical protein